MAREQCPTLDHLYQLASLTQDSGYNALGLYLEHRFHFPSTPWAHGRGALTPDHVESVQAEFPSLQIIPMINLLSHMEGFLYTERGRDFAAQRFKGMMGNPLDSAFIELCEKLVEDTISVFSSEIIHLGGDETDELFGANGFEDAATVYGEHYGPLAMMVLKNGRRPALWGDMLLAHPEVAQFLPKETLIFDWQYFGSVIESARQLQSMGFEVVACPTLQTYNAAWMHLDESEANVVEVVEDAEAMDLAGVCLTTWECGLFGAYDTLFSAIRGVGNLMNGQSKKSPHLLAAYMEESEGHAHWCRLMGDELNQGGPALDYSKNRSRLKCRFLLYSNPFLLWLHHRDEWVGAPGDNVLRILDLAAQVAPTEAERGVTHFVRCAVDFVRIVDQAAHSYREGSPADALTVLAPLRPMFDDLAKIARQNHQRIGGSLADGERCLASKAHLEKVMTRIRDFGQGKLGYLPSFEHLCHPKFVPHDQGAWWKINSWANE